MEPLTISGVRSNFVENLKLTDPRGSGEIGQPPAAEMGVRMISGRLKKNNTWALPIAGILGLVATGLSIWTQAAETITYSYDAAGRIKNVQIVGGPSSGVARSYQYDRAGNRTQFVTTGAASGSAMTISPTSNVSNLVSGGAVIAVNVNGNGSPNGVVTFTENGVFLGSAYTFDNRASIFLEGLTIGTHTINVTYSGDGSNEPYSQTITIRVQNLSWLPAVIDLLLSN